MPETSARLSRLQVWIIALSCIIVFAAFAAPLAVISYNQRAANETQLVVACTNAKSNKSTLEALQSFSEQIGVPWVYPIPEVPPECDGS